MAAQYFTNLFTSIRPQLDERSLRGVHKVIIDDMNKELSREFTTEEVSLALRHMAPLKASGPDGMPALFYHSFWHILRSHVTNAVLSCLNSCKIPKSINHTFITLIPKSQAPKECLISSPLVYVMLYIKSCLK